MAKFDSFHLTEHEFCRPYKALRIDVKHIKKDDNGTNATSAGDGRFEPLVIEIFPNWLEIAIIAERITVKGMHSLIPDCEGIFIFDTGEKELAAIGLIASNAGKKDIALSDGFGYGLDKGSAWIVFEIATTGKDFAMIFAILAVLKGRRNLFKGIDQQLFECGPLNFGWKFDILEVIAMLTKLLEGRLRGFHVQAGVGVDEINWDWIQTQPHFPESEGDGGAFFPSRHPAIDSLIVLEFIETPFGD